MRERPQRNDVSREAGEGAGESRSETLKANESNEGIKLNGLRIVANHFLRYISDTSISQMNGGMITKKVFLL